MNEIRTVQKIIQAFDVTRCKTIAIWLSKHINNLEVDMAYFKINIQQLQLSARTYNVLIGNNIHTIGELLIQSSDWNNIKKLKGAGEKVLDELRETVYQIRICKFKQLTDTANTC